MSFINKIFKIKENNSTISKEILGGIITFFSICYVLFLNPEIIANDEVNKASLYSGTVICAIIATTIMMVVANKPLAMAPAMGLNSVIAITVCSNLGFSFSESLALTLLSAVIFLILTLTKLRIKILDAMPSYLVKAIGIGIGLFIAMVGLKNSTLIVGSDSTLITLGDFTNPTTLTALISLMIIIILTILHIKGSIMITLILTLITSLILNATIGDGINYNGIFSLPEMPYFSGFINGFRTFNPGDIINIIIALFSITFLAMFSSLGSIIITADDLNLNNQKEMNKVMLADSLGLFISSFCGTSPTCILAETATGVKEGARTGLANLITIILMILALFLSPLLSLIGVEVTASILIMIGVSSLADIKNIDFTNLKEAIPSFFAILFMPLTYSIINGIAFATITLTIINLVSYDKSKKFKENIHPLILVLSIFFIAYYCLMLI